MKIAKLPSSYKDPSGFVFQHQGKIFRQINEGYEDTYKHLMTSGLYKKLIDTNTLIPHTEVDLKFNKTSKTIIEPKPIPFISYPYEWSFSQLKDAALLTLFVQKTALSFGMSLKDASAFNIQFIDGKPIFIDTLSFEMYKEGKPWIAYKQFCEHFLAPLALMAHTDFRLQKLFSSYLNGIPLDLAAKLLPLQAKVRPANFLHIFLHARSQKTFIDESVEKKSKGQRFTKHSFLGLVDSLESSIQHIKLPIAKTVWSSYYNDNNYQDATFNKKKDVVTEYVKKVSPKTLWDMGANTGVFSRIAAKLGVFTVAMDSDFIVVEQNYLEMKKQNEKNILPLWIDITNPSASIGFAAQERDSLFKRPLPDAILALALIHHLAIGHNIPLATLAEFFAQMTNWLIIEFVSKEDSQVKRLLQNREDIFPNYTKESFKKEFSTFFVAKNETLLPNSHRTLYLMQKRKS